jgi:hypothetical protein
MARRIRRLAAACGLLCGLGAGGAAAQDLTGVSTVEAKDVVLGTVTLEGVAYRVSETTRLVDASGRRIGLAELPVAKQVQGAWLMSPDSSVEYELRPGGGELASLRVLGTVPE